MRCHGIRAIMATAVADAARPTAVMTCRSHRICSIATSRLLRANQIWLADITYIETDQGWLYLAAVMDLYSRSDRRLGDG